MFVKTVLYLDELLLVNFVIGAALLLCAGLLCARQCSGLRLVLGSSVAAAAALGILLPELPFLPALAYKAATCCGTVAAAYGLPGRRSFAKLCAWYILLNLLLCGAVVLPGVQGCNFCVYLPLSPGRLLLSCAMVYAVLRSMLFCFGRAGPRSFPAQLLLAGAGAPIPVQAFCDTGFAVQDPLTGRAVVLVHYPAVRTALPQALQAYLDGYFAGSTAPPPPQFRVRLVPCATIAGHSVLPAVPAQELRAGPACVREVLAAFCQPDAPPEHWTLLLGSELADQLAVRWRRISFTIKGVGGVSCFKFCSRYGAGFWRGYSTAAARILLPVRPAFRRP